ncbi:hypothetical protein FI667_g17223, partial [Globisporangium splendens]
MDLTRLQHQNYRFHRKITETSYSDLYEYELLAPGNFVLTRVAVKQISFTRSRTYEPAWVGREQPRTVTDDPNRDQLAEARLLAHQALGIPFTIVVRISREDRHLQDFDILEQSKVVVMMMAPGI